MDHSELAGRLGIPEGTIDIGSYRNRVWNPVLMDVYKEMQGLCPDSVMLIGGKAADALGKRRMRKLSCNIDTAVQEQAMPVIQEHFEGSIIYSKDVDGFIIEEPRGLIYLVSSSLWNWKIGDDFWDFWNIDGINVCRPPYLVGTKCARSVDRANKGTEPLPKDAIDIATVWLKNGYDPETARLMKKYVCPNCHKNGACYAKFGMAENNLTQEERYEFRAMASAFRQDTGC